jgi:hypothetical protein
MTPLRLTDDQLRCVMQAARRVPVSARDEVLQEVAERSSTWRASQGAFVFAADICSSGISASAAHQWGKR